jgi:diguanylate cyclase (GGDEF)-like protein
LPMLRASPDSHFETAYDGLHDGRQKRSCDVSGASVSAVHDVQRSRWQLVLGMVTLVVVAVAQLVLDPALPMDLLYVVPVMAVAAAGGRRPGLVAAALAALLGAAVETRLGAAYDHPAYAVLAFGLALLVYASAAWFAAEVTTAAVREREQALTDPLTGLGNRRYFEGVAEHELNRSRRYGRPLALAYVDIDRFKQVNDEQGHAAGDALLRCIAAELPLGLRRSDVVARIGGDEFAILLPETPATGAETALRKLRERLQTMCEDAGYDVEFSVGIATCEDGSTTVKALLGAADATMYAAKRTGAGLVVGDARLPDPVDPHAR